MLGTINEVVMSEMYDATSMSDIGKQSGAFSSSSDSVDIMSKLNSKLLKMKGEIKTADNHMVKKIIPKIILFSKTIDIIIFFHVEFIPAT